MHPTASRILELLDQPEALEALYRGDPEFFSASLADASREAPDHATLRVWRARLEYGAAASSVDRRRVWHAIGVVVAVAAGIRIPTLWLEPEWYFPRFGPSLALLAPAAYFWLEHRERRGLIALLTLAAVAGPFASLLPDLTDSVVMALIHLPILFWALLGLAFTGGAWRESEARMRFVRYNGELLILASLVTLGGIVFSGITMALIQLVFGDSEAAAEWYVLNVGVVGATAVPVAATCLYDVVFKRHTGIASVLARVFAPLFLVMIAVYLPVAFVGGQNPFMDREALIVFNGLLLVVLGMTVFSIAERGERAEVSWIDTVNVALLVATLVIDLIALSAILFRLTSYGLTPNRVVVLGANVVITIHLAWTCRAYVGLVRKRGDLADIRRAVTGYLPAYAAWAALVTFVLPFVFRFS
jgi:hypothetical protein